MADKKCPKCGAGPIRGADRAIPAREEWECGTYRWCSRVEESRESLRRQLAQAQETLDRLADYGINTASFGDGDAIACWDRIDAFRSDPSDGLALDDQRELAEWWAELHTSLSDLDEMARNDHAENKRLREGLEFLACQPCQLANTREEGVDIKCSTSGDCITEWCFSCYARAALEGANGNQK